MNTSKENDFPLLWKIVLVIFCVFLLAASTLFIYKFYLAFDGNMFPSGTQRDDWGTFGDYFGGTLNPIFGFASFIALLATIIYQGKELKLSRTELELTRTELASSATALKNQNKAIELQSFEQTFFSWLLSYQELLKAIEDENVKYMPSPESSNHFEKLLGKPVKSPKNGRSQLHYWWGAYLSEHSVWQDISSMSHEVIPISSINKAKELKLTNRKERGYLLLIAGLHSTFVVDHILTNWNELYSAEEYQLDSLFRTLYRLISWIDSQHESRLSLSQKWLYVSIIRSQLSWIEMSYLFFNGLTDRGNKFKLLVEKYALLDNFTIESDATIEIIKKYYLSEKNYSDMAFSSELARQKLGLPKSSEETLALATTATPQHT